MKIIFGAALVATSLLIALPGLAQDNSLYQRDQQMQHDRRDGRAMARQRDRYDRQSNQNPAPTDRQDLGNGYKGHRDYNYRSGDQEGYTEQSEHSDSHRRSRHRQVCTWRHHHRVCRWR